MFEIGMIDQIMIYLIVVNLRQLSHEHEIPLPIVTSPTNSSPHCELPVAGQVTMGIWLNQPAVLPLQAASRTWKLINNIIIKVEFSAYLPDENKQN
jgi:hypothetical protein